MVVGGEECTEDSEMLCSWRSFQVLHSTVSSHMTWKLRELVVCLLFTRFILKPKPSALAAHGLPFLTLIPVLEIVQVGIEIDCRQRATRDGVLMLL